MEQLSSEKKDLPHLLRELEDSVNRHSLELLKNQPFTITISGFLPPGSTDSNETTDLEFTYPSLDSHYPDLKYLTQYSDDHHYTVAMTEIGPVVFTVDGDIIKEARAASIDELESLIELSGIPPTMLTGNDQTEEILTFFARQSKRLNFTRKRELAVHPTSTLTITQEDQLLKLDDSTECATTQELSFIFWHHHDIEVGYELKQALNTPTTYPEWANHLVFRRDEQASRWNYWGAYQGEVRPGELTDEFDDQSNDLVLPSSNLIKETIRTLQTTKT